MHLGARLGIPQKVLAVYDRITEAMKSLIGKQDIIKQFYAQMETGKFRNSQQAPGGDSRIREMHIDPERASRIVMDRSGAVHIYLLTGKAVKNQLAHFY